MRILNLLLREILGIFKELLIINISKLRYLIIYIKITKIINKIN
jgi:hypothetical protein